MNRPTRRRILKLTAGALSGVAAARVGLSGARADAAIESHGLSAFGDLAYPPDFEHFSYVDPNAPKGGIFSQIGPDQIYNQNFLTFNSLNTFILKGDAAQGMELTFATLMVRSGDEPDAMYGLAAAKVRRSADGLDLSILHPSRSEIRRRFAAHRARRRLLADDTQRERSSADQPVAARFRRRHGGRRRQRHRAFCAEARRATCRCSSPDCRFSRAPITRRGRSTNRPSTSRSAREPTKSAASSRAVTSNTIASRIGGAPICRSARGQSNFDIVRFEYYRDRDVGFEGFSAGTYLFREEFTSRFWATRYDFPAVKDGRVKRDEIPDDTPSGAQGWFINTRRPQFADARVRDALNDAFDFEWTNKTIMYNAYQRTVSVFQNSDLMAVGLPGAAELALLEPFRGRLPAEVFGEAYTPPVSDGSGEDRPLLRKAAQVLQEAGCVLRNGKRMLPSGEPITVEFLIDEPSFEPHHMPFIKNLGILGIEATLRIVDPVQYRARLDNFDFDITIDRFSFSATPGDSLRSYFSSQAAALHGSNNLAGIADPVVDALIEAIIAADSRPALVTACRALDRVIRAGRYWIPNWYKASHWIAYWDVFGRPPAQPRYFRGIPDTWWYDPAKAAKIHRPG